MIQLDMLPFFLIRYLHNFFRSIIMFVLYGWKGVVVALFINIIVIKNVIIRVERK